MSTELSCPFCDGAGSFDGDLPGIMCDECGATGPTVSEQNCDPDADDDETEAAAWSFWNKRDGAK